MHSFIQSIEIYPHALENGQILKSIQLRFPVHYQGNDTNTLFSDLENTVECVGCLYELIDK